MAPRPRSHGLQFSEPITPEKFFTSSANDGLMLPQMSPSGAGNQSGVQRKTYQRRTPKEKLDTVVQTINSLNWTLFRFLEAFFKPKQSGRTDTHRAALTKFLQSTDSGVDGIRSYAAIIVNMIYENELGRPPTNEAEYDQMFSHEKAYTDLRYARPVISTWATELITARLVTESNRLIRPDAGLRVRASRKPDRKLPESAPGDSNSGAHPADSTADLADADESGQRVNVAVVGQKRDEIVDFVVGADDEEDEWEDVENAGTCALSSLPEIKLNCTK